MNLAILQFLTDFGDQAVILPAFVVVALVLLVQRKWFLAASWVVAVAGVLGTMLVLKLAGQSCGWTVPVLVDLDLVNPSGHTASATTLWGCGAALLLAGRGTRTVVAAMLAALLGFGLIGLTRVALDAHTTSEALLGGTVGLAGAVLFGLVVRGPAPARLSSGVAIPVSLAIRPVLAALVVMAATHGHHLRAEPTIHSAAVTLIRRAIPACQPPPGNGADGWTERRNYNRP